MFMMTVDILTDGQEWSNDSGGSDAEYDEESELFEQECDVFMKDFVAKIFLIKSDISQEDKLKFGILNQHSAGRLSFAKHVDNQRVYFKSVPETIFFRLVQYFAIVLFECNQADDFEPAKILMNMCFTFFLEVNKGSEESSKQFIVPYLRDQPICDLWHSWSPEEQMEYEECDKNSMFGKLGTFLSNMKAFGLSKDICKEFLLKMSTIGELNQEQILLLEKSLDQATEDERRR
ncbi:hypothetical protein ABFA07_008952 [Porites harrisoni]